MSEVQNLLSQSNTCMLIPTYNNEKTLGDVIQRVIGAVGDTRIIVVNDGSTDSTPLILDTFGERLTLIAYKENQGKGNALRLGFKKAIELGYDNVMTIDSDGQHFPEDIHLLAKSAIENPGHVLMGSRNMNHETVPGKSSFGNKFSNFWFTIETAHRLPDTQTGFRLYPLEKLKKMKLFTKKFELEIEVIVRLAWRFVKFKAVPIRVLYDMDERVSHFRPARDFFRISILNSVLFTLATVYYYPRKILMWKW